MKLGILVNFTDPENLIDRMYINHQTTEERQVALIQYMGLRKATFNTLIEGDNHFIIYYELKNGMKAELQYNFIYEVPIEEPNTPEPNEPGETLWNNPLLIPIIGTALLALVTCTFIFVKIIKRRKK